MSTRKKIGDVEGDVLVTGAVVVVGVFAIKSLISNFGTDPANKQLVEDQAATTPAQNPFSPNFQPYLDFWAANQPSGLSVSDGMWQLNQMANDGTLQPGSEGYNTVNWFGTIQDALSVWNWTSDVNAVMSVFNQMTSQLQCAALAAYASYVDDKDLLHWLHYGGSPIPFVPNGLSTDQVAEIVRLVNALPVTN